MGGNWPDLWAQDMGLNRLSTLLGLPCRALHLLRLGVGVGVVPVLQVTSRPQGREGERSGGREEQASHGHLG